MWDQDEQWLLKLDDAAGIFNEFSSTLAMRTMRC